MEIPKYDLTKLTSEELKKLVLLLLDMAENQENLAESYRALIRAFKFKDRYKLLFSEN